MHDLIGAYDRINAVYRMYIESAFPLRYANMAEERQALYKASNTLSQPPLLEPTPVYTSSNLTLAEACSLLPEEYCDLPEMATGLLGSPNLRLWRHQWESLRTVLQEKRDLVVTTGTGSGKTECFLLPIMGEIARESARWPSSPLPLEDRKWWRDNSSGWQGQWEHTGRRNRGLHAIRAMVLYPLNALVEDQLRRLRQTLDSDHALRWMDQMRSGNRVTFGRYTGATPVPGRPSSSSAVERLRERLQQTEAECEAVKSEEGLPAEARYYFPNIDGGEMWSRWDMQQTPPDILITNYHMLNIMLMRQVEQGMLNQTRAWLESDPSNRFFLVVDELHSYRGTQGTEVGYILRLLLDRLGLSVNSDQLVVIATSASVTDSEESREFLQQFFGRDNFKIVSEGEEQPDPGASNLMAQFGPAFEEFAHRIQPDVLCPMSPPDPESAIAREAMSELAATLCPDNARLGEPGNALADALIKIKADHAIRETCASPVGNGEIRASKVADIDRQLFASDARDQTASDAMRGFLLALGMSKKEADGISTQPVRGHFFYHNVQNLWVCVNPACDADAHLLTVEGSRRSGKAIGPVGSLHAQHRITCSCGGRVLDLLVCEVCGDILLGGYRGKVSVHGESAEVLTADIPNIADMPSRPGEDRNHGEYAVFWPLPEDDPDGEPEDRQYVRGGLTRTWIRAGLSTTTGLLVSSSKGAGRNQIPGWVYRVVGQSGEEQNGLPPKCPRCDSDYSRRRRFPTPFRLHRTGFQKACQVIAGALTRELPLERQDKPARKLLIFTDSRQDAAKLASGMEQDHYRDMVRVLLLKALDEYWRIFESALRVYAGPTGKTEKVLAVNDRLEEALSKEPDEDDQYRALRFDSRWRGELYAWLFDAPDSNSPFLESLLGAMKDYPGRVPLNVIRDMVKQEFLLLGFNPGGNSYDLSQYTADDISHSWRDCYDWTRGIPQEKAGLSPQAVRHLGRIDNSLTSELMFTLFQHSTRTLEGLGAGWATFHYDNGTDEAVVGAVESIIRQLGVKRRYQGQEFFWGLEQIPPGAMPLPRRTRDYLENAAVPEIDVVDALRESGVGVMDNDTLGLRPERIYITKGPGSFGDGGRQGWRCPRCGSFYLHPTGRIPVCPECREIEMETDSARDSFDYYLYLAEQSGPAFRLRCEELTGQTDDTDRQRRQRWFQEVFVGEEKDSQRVAGVDLLSVTTTMEAGVDIGGLEAVMMANMPPRRFNYQQRVGRAGRRGAGASLAVTFCRGRSHDDYYYQRPEQITGDPPPQPYVDVSSKTIFRRVFVKEVLRLAFADVGVEQGDEFRDSVHGEFGPASSWNGKAEAVAHWMNSIENQATIEKILMALSAGTIWDAEAVGDFGKEMMNYARGDLLNDISELVSREPNPEIPLSECLAKNGLLPMFGFPTGVRQLFTQRRYSRTPWPPASGTIDRQLDISISQFAPGSQLVKDKAVHTASGVGYFYPQGNRVRLGNGFDPPLSESNPAPLGLCRTCKSVQFRESISDNRPCEVCKSVDLAVIDAREPKGFFTDFQPQDYDGIFEWTPRSTVATLTWKTPPVDSKLVANCDILSFSDDLLSINDNDGRGGFEFQRARITGPANGPGAYAVDPGKDKPLTVSGPKQIVALLSQKKTDVLLVGIKQWPTGVFADPRDAVGRAAWFSFAFFLRSSAAALLDADPMEFSSGFRPFNGPYGEVVGQAFLSDTLENGAGYSWWLGQPENFEKLLGQGDMKQPGSMAKEWLLDAHGLECDTSCNRCLRDFYNLSYHGLLDWRLSIDMARMAMNSAAPLDLKADWDGFENPWTTICEGAGNPVSSTLESLGYEPQAEFGGLQVYLQRRFNQLTIIRHPLWTDSHPEYMAVRDEVQKRFEGYTVDALSPFEVIRNPSRVMSGHGI